MPDEGEREGGADERRDSRDHEDHVQSTAPSAAIPTAIPRSDVIFVTSEASRAGFRRARRPRLVGQILADAAELGGVSNALARNGIWAVAILFPAGFFLSSAGRARTEPNALTVLLRSGGQPVSANDRIRLRSSPLRYGETLAVIEPLRSSRLMRDLSAWMPGGLMLILLVYLLRAPAQESVEQGAVAAGAVALVIGLHWWRRNAFLSIFAGTTLYVVATSC